MQPFKSHRGLVVTLALASGVAASAGYAAPARPAQEPPPCLTYDRTVEPRETDVNQAVHVRIGIQDGCPAEAGNIASELEMGRGRFTGALRVTRVMLEEVMHRRAEFLTASANPSPDRRISRARYRNNIWEFTSIPRGGIVIEYDARMVYGNALYPVTDYAVLNVTYSDGTSRRRALPNPRIRVNGPRVAPADTPMRPPDRPTARATPMATGRLDATAQADLPVTPANGTVSHVSPWRHIPRDTLLPSEPVGTLEGSSQVSPAGAYRYTIPLWVPPGRAGMQPDLALVYDSHEGNGMLGVGWSLAGQSAITRCGKNLSRDGEVDTVNFDNDDNFCLDGQKLVPFEGRLRLPRGFQPPSLPLYGEYRTERESFTRVAAFGSPEPTLWVAWTRGGLVKRYGDGGNSHMSAVRFGTDNDDTYGWLLSRIEDRRGNSIRYHYFVDPTGSASRFLDAIIYTESPSAPYASSAKRSVVFSYEGRPDEIDRWVNGLNLHVGLRLKRIDVKAPAPATVKTVRSYVLTYGESKRTKRSLVTSVAVCDGQGVCLPETTFRYAQPSSDTPVAYTSGDYPIEDLDYVLHPHLIVFDANGDGFDDVLYDVFDYGWQAQDDDGTLLTLGTQPRLRLSRGTLGGAYADPPIDLAPLFPSFLPGDLVAYGRDAYVPVSGVLDYDANGAVDLFGIGLFGDSWAHRIFRWDAAQSKPVLTDAWSDQCANTQDCTFYSLDFDGDALTDLATIVGGNWRFHMNGTEGDSDSSAPSAFPVPLAYLGQPALDPRAQAIDVDGNGTRDLVDVEDNFNFRVIGLKQGQFYSTPYPQNLRRAVFADVNGDGLEDIVHPLGFPEAIDPAYPYVQINTGNGFAPPYQAGTLDFAIDGVTVPDFDPDAVNVRVADFNGDGRDDLLLLYVGPDWIQQVQDAGYVPPAVWFPIINLWLSDGRDFYDNPLSSSWQGGNPLEIALHLDAGYMAVQLGDVNNDGKPEIIYVSVDNPAANATFEPPECANDPCYYGQCCGTGFELSVAIQIPDKEPFYDLMVELRNGLGATEHIEYGPHSPDGVADPDPFYLGGATPLGAFPEQWLRRGPPLVKRHTVEQPGGVGDRAFEYRYEGARSDLRGRGRLGFHRVVVRDLALGATVETEYDQTRVEGPSDIVAYPFAGLPTERTTTVPLADDGDRLTVEKFEYDVEWINTRYRVDLRRRVVNEYQAQPPPLQWLAVRTTTTEYEYDAFSNPTSTKRTVTGGYTETVTRSFENRVPDWLLGLPLTRAHTSRTPDGTQQTRRIAYVHDASGLVEEVVVEPGPSVDADTRLWTQLTRNVAGLVTAITRIDAGGETRSESFAYDQDGVFPIQQTDALNHVDFFGYHPGIGQMAIASDANGVVSQWKYDGFGRLRKAVAPDGAHVKVDYASGSGDFPLKVKTTHATGFQETTVYDFLLRPRSTQWATPDGPAGSNQMYDVLGRVVRQTLPPKAFGDSIIYFVNYTYDNLGRPLSTAYADGASETWEYPSFWLVQHTDRAGRIARREYSSDGLLVKVQRDVDGAWQTSRFEYGPFRLPITLRDPLSEVQPAAKAVEMEYDVSGRRTQIRDPNAGTVEEAYNAFGELRWQRDGAGNERTFVYDTLGRLIERTSEDGVDAYQWGTSPGARHRLVGSTSADGVIIKDFYDALGRPTMRRYISGTEQHEVAQSYDGVGRLRRIRYPKLPDGYQLVARYHYGAGGELDRVFDETAGHTLWQAIKRDPSLRLTRDRLGGVVETTWGYDAATRLLTQMQTTKIGATQPLLDLTYSYRMDGRMKYRHDVVADVWDYAEYDDLGRMDRWISSHQGQQRPVDYEYDLAGRLTAVKHYEPIQTTLTYDYPAAGQPRPHAPTAVGEFAYIYDGGGRQVKRNHTGYGVDRELIYNSHNLPRSGVIGGQSFTIAYDAHGERFRKQAATATTYVGDLYERRIGPDGALHVHYVYAGPRMVAQIEHAGGGTKTKYLLQDRLGSLAAVLDQTGEVVERLFYAPHGERLNVAGAAVGGSAAGLRPGFTGHEHDDDLGLVNMRGRVYDPGLRRFLSPDPSIGQAANGLGIDRYAYVANDPFNRVDPTGFQEEPPPPPPSEDFPPPGETEVDVWYEGEPPEWCYACNDISYYDRPDVPHGGDSSSGGGYVEPLASASYDPGAGEPASEAPGVEDHDPYFHGPCPPSCGGDYIGPEGAVIILTVTGLRTLPFLVGVARHLPTVGQVLARTAPAAQTLQTGLGAFAESVAGPGAVGVGVGTLANATTLPAKGAPWTLPAEANRIASGAGYAIDASLYGKLKNVYRQGGAEALSAELRKLDVTTLEGLKRWSQLGMDSIDTLNTSEYGRLVIGHPTIGMGIGETLFEYGFYGEILLFQ